MANAYRQLAEEEEVGNYEEEEAQIWRQRAHQEGQKTVEGSDEFIDRSKARRMPDRTWMVNNK